MHHEPSRTGTGKQPAASTHGPQAAGSATASGTAEKPAGDGQNPSRRRRGHGYVTPNACTECRGKRAKCDGQSPCARCKSQGLTPCIYRKPVRQSKESMRREIEVLKSYQDKSDHAWPDVVARLRNGQSVESISEWLSGALPSPGSAGVGALPAVVNLAISSTPSSFGNTNIASYASGSGGCSPITSAPIAIIPGTSQHRRALNYDAYPGSASDGPFSARSQFVSTTGQPYLDLMNCTTGTPPQQQMVAFQLGDADVSEGQTFRRPDEVLLPGLPVIKDPAGAWTKITDDSRLVRHLLALYFCWEYPIFAPLSKEQFLGDFQDGCTRYCSSILVNALLALACRFSTQRSVRVNPDDPHSPGDQFFKESLQLLYQEKNHHNLTTIQALGIMSVREASYGRGSESRYYARQSIRLANEMGLHRIHGDGLDNDETAVKLATFWGAFTLDLTWSLSIGSLPQCSFVPHLPSKLVIVDEIEASLWVPYTDDGAPSERPCHQPSNVRSVFKCFCELSELVHQSLYISHAPDRTLTSRELLHVYGQYINWYDNVPLVLRLGLNFTPSVIFAHMYYHFAILLLFRPLIKLRIIGSIVFPRDICLEAANAIQTLSRSYSRLYTLKRTPCFVPYIVLAASLVHLTIGVSLLPITPTSSQAFSDIQLGPSGQSSAQLQQWITTTQIDPHIAEAINWGIEDLKEMATCYPFAETALDILLRLIKKWKIEVASEEGELDKDGPENRPLPAHAFLLNPGGTWPVTDSLNSPKFFASGVEEGAQTTLHPTAGLEAMDGPTLVWRWEEEDDEDMPEAMENPLFWPFPTQGHPTLPTGDKLREAGFELLLPGELS